MKFGSKLWFEQLNARVKWPSKFAFYYNKKDNLIHGAIVDSKAQVENVRYKDIKPTPLLFHPKETALISVKDIETPQEYYDEVYSLHKLWGTKLDIEE